MLIHEVKEACETNRKYGLKHSPNYALRHWDETVMGGINDAAIVKIDNIAAYSRANLPSLEWPKATPFNTCTWVEWESEEDGFCWLNGSLIICGELPQEQWDVRGRWLVGSYAFMKALSGPDKGHLRACPYEVITTLEADGRWNREVLHFNASTKERVHFDESDFAQYSEMMTAAFPLIAALTAFCFTHCRNVEKVEYTEPWYKKSKRTLLKVYGGEVKYHTIQIEPIKKKSTDPAPVSEDTKSNRALHICRGHFKTYEPGHGLFGKYVGQYWWGQQLRGNKAAGMVISDYSTEKLAR